MDFDRLRIFFEVVEEGSFSKVAEKQYVSQRAISQSIKKLENDLGFPLFIREKNKIIITKAGEHFYQKTKALYHNYEIEVNYLRSNQKSISQNLNVGYFSPFEGMLLRKHIHKILENDNSKLNFVVTNESIEHLVSDVRLGQLDFAYILDYGSSFASIKDTISSLVIYQNQMVIGISDLNPQSRLNYIPTSVLVNTPILYYTPEESEYLKQAFISTLPSMVDKLKVARVDSIQQMQMIVSLNQAVAFYPNGLLDAIVGSSQYINFWPLEKENRNQQYKIRLIYDNNSPKIKSIKNYFKLLKLK